jgi:DNA-binding LacI/PurR family transcriptional regulator
LDSDATGFDHIDLPPKDRVSSCCRVARSSGIAATVCLYSLTSRRDIRPNRPFHHRSTQYLRRDGYLAALRDAGITADPASYVEAAFTVDGGEQATNRLLRLRQRPTAIFAACDEMAMGAMRALRHAGIRVPEEISVIGIDDHDLAAAVGLTTVTQPAADQGRLAAEAVLKPLLGQGPLASGEQLLPTQLVVRESTAPPPRQTARLKT